MMEMFRRAHEHQGAAFVEIYQNCNVFNDGAFEQPSRPRTVRADMLIPLEHGEPIRFGADGEQGRRCSTTDGESQIVERRRRRRGRASSCTTRHATTRRSRSCCRGLAPARTSRRRSACSAPSTGPTTRAEVERQLAAAQEQQGPGDLRRAPALRRRPGRVD